MLKNYPFIFVVIFAVGLFLFFGKPVKAETEDSKKFKPAKVVIEKKKYEIYYRIVKRSNLDESSEYQIKSFETEGFYVVGYRRREGRVWTYEKRDIGSRTTVRWNVEVHNIPLVRTEESVLLDVFLDRPNNESRAIYKQIFWQLYEQI